MFLLYILPIAGVLGFVVYFVLTDVEEKAVVRQSLRQLEG